MSKRKDFVDWLSDKEHRYALEKWLWIIFVPIAFVTGLVNSVAIVSLLSIYALVITAGGAQQAARAAREAAISSEKPAEDRADSQ